MVLIFGLVVCAREEAGWRANGDVSNMLLAWRIYHDENVVISTKFMNCYLAEYNRSQKKDGEEQETRLYQACFLALIPGVVSWLGVSGSGGEIAHWGGREGRDGSKSEFD